MKQIIFLKSRGPAEALNAWLLDQLASPAAVGAAQLAINLVTPPAAEPTWDAAIEVWSDFPVSASPVWAELDSQVSSRATFTVTELVEKDTGPARGWPTPGVKLLVPWIGRRDITPAETRRHWDEHVPLANRIHVGVTRYVRNWIEPGALDGGDGFPGYNGIASQHFLTEQDLLERSFDSPASVQIIIDDVAEFISEHVALRVIEYFRTA